MKTSRFTVKSRPRKNISPKFEVNPEILQRKKHSLKNRENQVSPRKATLRRYNINRPIGDVDIPNTPRRKGRFREIDVEDDPRKFLSNHVLQRTKFGLTDAMLKGKKRVLKHSHRSQSPRRDTVRRYNMRRHHDDVDIPNTPRRQGRYNVIDVEPMHHAPTSPTLRMKRHNEDYHTLHMTKNKYLLNIFDEGEPITKSSSSTRKKRKSRK
jgi:hypothetical protein